MGSHLNGRVALVVNAGRPAGAVVAAMLLESGAVVYMGGGNINARKFNGTGWAVRVDGSPYSIEQAFARISREHGRLNLVFSEIWGGYDGFLEPPDTAGGEARWRDSFVKHTSHFSRVVRAAVPLMSSGGGIIVAATAWAYGRFTPGHRPDLEKVAAIRTLLGSAALLTQYNIATIGLAPDPDPFTQYTGRTRNSRRPPKDWSNCLAHAVFDLVTDERVLEKSGRLMGACDLAGEYQLHSG